MAAQQSVLDAYEAMLAQLDAYIAEYEFGEEGYTPSEFERLLIADAIHGLTSDEAFMTAFSEWRRLIKEAR